MRKKLLIGLAAVMIVLVTASLFIVRELNLIISHRSLIKDQEQIIDSYEEVEVGIRESILALYRHRAGDTHALTRAVPHIGTLEKDLDNARATSARMQAELCEGCHVGRLTKLDEIRNTLGDMRIQLREFHTLFKRRADRATTNGDRASKDEEIIARGALIVQQISKSLLSFRKMRDENGKRMSDLADRSKTTVYVALGVSVAFALLAFVVMIRAVTRPIDAFVKGIKSVTEGRFQDKIEIRSKDEIGVLAGAFNRMIDRLNEMYEEKDRNLALLSDFNVRLEERVREATAGLVRANRELKVAQEQMVRAETMAAIGTLSSGISHELRTPLSVVLNMAQLIKQDIRDNPSLLKDIEVIEYEANQAIKITRSLLGFARSTKSKKEITQVNDVLEDLIKILEFQPKARSIRLIMELDPNVDPIQAGVGQLRQVFLNVILNAVQAMPEGGELRVATRNCREPIFEGVEITISDTGVGIPKEQVKQIFQPFFTTKEEGTGLGLAITYGIVREHNGKIEVDSAEGRGTTFRFFLPKGPDEGVA
jgi:two-component system NtrC family sensor kinase